MSDAVHDDGSSILKWGVLGCGGIVVVFVVMVIVGVVWNYTRPEPETISMHGAVVLTSQSEFRLTGEKTETGLDRCTGSGSRSVLNGEQSVTIRPSNGSTTKLALEPGFINEDGDCEMWFIGQVRKADRYVIAAPTFDNMTFQASMIDTQGRTGTYLVPRIRSTS